MTYIYDILLNFNNDFYEFYEWEKTDVIFHIKKIPIYKVSCELIESLLTKKVKIDDPLALEIQNRTEVFDNKKIRIIKYACLFTDSYRVIGVLLNDDYTVTKVSDLLLDEACDTIDISKRCQLKSVTYNIIGNKKDYSFLTRKEIKIKKYLISELKNAYHKKDIDKLEYLYFEYFNKNCLDIDNIYNELMESFKKEITLKHLKLYELMKLCDVSPSLSNLTNN